MQAILPAFVVSQNNTQIYIYHADIGEGLPKHEHNYTHLTICVSGSIAVRKDGIERIMTKNSKPVNLKSNEWHEIEALEDGTVFINVFAEGKY